MAEGLENKGVEKTSDLHLGVVSTKHFAESTAAVLRSTQKRGVPIVVTERGIPGFLLIPITAEDLVPLLNDMVPDLFDSEIAAAQSALEAGDVISPQSGQI